MKSIEDSVARQMLKQQNAAAQQMKKQLSQAANVKSNSPIKESKSNGIAVLPPSTTAFISSIGLNLSRASSAITPQFSTTPISYTNNIKLTGDKTIDPLLAGGNSWWNTGTGADGSNPSSSADHTLTYSFMSNSTGLNATDANGFQALSTAQQNIIKDAFAYISSVVNVTFTEDNSSSGQIKLGSNVQSASAGYATYPNSAGTGTELFLANNQTTFSDSTSWDTGGYEWETIIHELGHTLGLKHPGNYNAGGGGTPGPYLTKSLDNRTNSIMSYNNDSTSMHLVESSGGGLASTYVNPDTYQVLDVSALQYLYGAATTASPTTYTFSDDEKFSKTIYDSNSSSTINLSGMTENNVVDLRGGAFRSSIGIRDAYADTGMTKDTYLKATSGGAKLSKLLGVPTYTGANNLGIAKDSKIQSVTGGSGNDTLISSSVIGGAAKLDGGAGNDSYFIASGDAAINDTGGGNDSVYVAKTTGTVWTVDAGHTTLTQTNTKTGSVLSTVTITGIEHVGIWDGKTVKPPAKLLFSPAEQKKVLAYASAIKEAPSKISIKA